MKSKLVILTFLVLITSFFTCLNAQCNTTSLFTSSKTIYLDSTNAVIRTRDEQTTIEINKTEIIISPGNEGRTMKGVCNSYTCNWNVPYKEGKTVIKSAMTDNGEDAKQVTITIEGKAGIVSLLITIDNEPNKRIKVIADKFEQKQ